MNPKELHEALMRPFPLNLLRWRIGPKKKDGTACIPLAYIDSRDVMRRLDEVVGPTNWQSKMVPVGNGRLACELSIRYDDEWITKTDGAGETDVEGAKGVFSDALKRAAVLHGVGRYLYALPNKWVDLNGDKFTPPDVPKWATPEGYDEAMRKRDASPMQPSVDHAVRQQVEKGPSQDRKSAELFVEAAVGVIGAFETVRDINDFLKANADKIKLLETDHADLYEQFKRDVTDARMALEEQ